MTDDQLFAGLALVALAVLLYVKFIQPMLNKHENDVDEIDISISKFKSGRTEQGLCVYCGAQVSDRPPVSRQRHLVCTRCYGEMHPE